MTMTSSGLEPLRPLGHLETFEAVRYARGLFSSVATSAVYSNPTSTQELQPLIFNAVRRVISQYPALSTVFVDAADESKQPRYARLPELDLRDCLVFEARAPQTGSSEDENDELDRLLERHHNTRFDERWGEVPLWRLIILHTTGDTARFVACFLHQHAIADGNAGPSFHRSFLAELCALSTGGQEVESPNTVVRAPDAAMPLSLESLHKLPLSAAYLLKMAWQERFPRSGSALWLGAPVTDPTRSRFRSFSLTAATTKALLAVCRTHAVTLTAMVHVLIAHAIFQNLPPDKTHLKSSIAIDLRRFLPAGALKPDEMGNYVSATYLDHQRPKNTTAICWTDAQRIKALIDNEVKLAGKNASTGCLRWVGNMHKYFSSKSGLPRDASFCLTNLGEFKAKEDAQGSWRTGRMVFSEGFDAAREAMDVTMVTGADGCLTLGLVWGDGVVEEALMVKVFESLKSLVIATAGEVP